MSVLGVLTGKARPQIPLEALVSSKHIGIYKTSYRGFVKSGMPYMLCGLSGNTDDDTQAFIGALSIDDEIEIIYDAKTARYNVFCDSIEFGSIDGAQSGYKIINDCEAFIQKIELDADDVYKVTIGVIQQQ